MNKTANKLTKTENAAILKHAYEMEECSMPATTVTVSNRGYIVLPVSIRKALELKPGTKMLISQDKDTLILKTVPSFTEKLAGLTKQSIAQTPEEVDAYIALERKDRTG